MDLAAAEPHETVLHDLALIANLHIADFFSFEISQTDALDNLDDGMAVRFRVRARLAERRFEEFQLDIGFDYVGTLTTERVVGDDVLGFAEIPPVEMELLPVEQHLAEKIHAYTRTYHGEQQSSRVKDLLDIVLLAELSSASAARLVPAIDTTFRTRAKHATPERLPLPPADWAPTYRTLAEEVAIDPRIESGFEVASTFLNPILGGHVSPNTSWSAEHRRWLAPGQDIDLDAG